MAFPTSLDTVKDTWSWSEAPYWHANHHNAMAVLLYAIQTKIGVNGSAVTSTIDYILKNTSSQNPGHKHTWSDIATKPTTLGWFGITDGVVNTSPQFKNLADPTKIATFDMSGIPTGTTRTYKTPDKNNEFLVTSTTERTGSSTDVLRGDGTWGWVGDNFIVAPNYAYAKFDPIAWNGTNWVKALATSIAGLDVYGLAATAWASGVNTTLIQRWPMWGWTGLTVGANYYVSNTGTITTTPGTYYCKIGYALSATMMMIDIEKVVNEQVPTNGWANNTSYYSAGFTTTRDFIAYLVSYGLDGVSQWGWALQFNSVDVIANNNSNMKWYWKWWTAVRGRVSNWNSSWASCSIRVCYTV